MKSPRVLAVVGATATGKSEVAERLAAAGGEVVCADSRQVYAELEIGTGKPTPAERAALPHHLFDALSLSARSGAPRASAGWYARELRPVCEAIIARGELPILVGGSGLYLRAAMEGLAPTPAVDPEVRRRLAAEIESAGTQALHLRLAASDAETAGRLHPNDRQRITRALEILESTGRSPAWWHAQQGEPVVRARWEVVELVVESGELRRRIAHRTRRMFDQGLIEETRGLLEAGLEAPLAGLRAVGYDEALAVIHGALDRAGAEERTSARTARLAKRQRTWFRHQVEGWRIEVTGETAERVAQRVLTRVGAAG
mgnify:CR=1 FL=1